MEWVDICHKRCGVQISQIMHKSHRFLFHSCDLINCRTQRLLSCKLTLVRRHIIVQITLESLFKLTISELIHGSHTLTLIFLSAPTVLLF